MATKIRAKWESSLTAVWLKWDPSVLSNAFAVFDPDRPEIKRHYDIGPQLDISTSCYEDSVQIVADKMPDSEY